MSDIGESDYDHGEPRIMSVYNGCDLLGHLAIARTIRAITPDNIEIGTFETQEEARAAVVRHSFAGRPI